MKTRDGTVVEIVDVLPHCLQKGDNIFYKGHLLTVVSVSDNSISPLEYLLGLADKIAIEFPGKTAALFSRDVPVSVMKLSYQV